MSDFLGHDRFVDDPGVTDTGVGPAPVVDLGAIERDPAAPGCPADVDGDGEVTFDDIDAFVAAFLAGDLAADIDGNGEVTFDDIDAFVAAFLAACS